MEDGWGRRGWRIEQITWHLKLWNRKLLTWSGIDNNDTLKDDTWTPLTPSLTTSLTSSLSPLTFLPGVPIVPLSSPRTLAMRSHHSSVQHSAVEAHTWSRKEKGQWTLSSKNDWHGNCMYRFMLSVSMGCLAASLSNSAFKRGVYRRPQSTTVSYKRTSLLLWVYRHCYILNTVSPPFCLPR